MLVEHPNFGQLLRRARKRKDSFVWALGLGFIGFRGLGFRGLGFRV